MKGMVEEPGDEDHWRRIGRIDDFQRYFERMAREHEKLRVKCHDEKTTEAFLCIIECLDEALRQSVGQTGELASLFFGVEAERD